MSTDLAALLGRIRLQLTALYGNQPGTAILFVGYDPYIDASGKYAHKRRVELPFKYEGELDLIAKAAADDMDTHDVYICGCPMRNDKRAKGNAASRMALHSDLDGGYDEAEVRAISGCAVGSGTPDHAQVLVPLTESVDAARYERMCRLLRQYLGAADAKVVDNDVLRLIGTYNHKPRVFKNGPPAPVQWLLEYDGTRVDPDVLEAQLTQLVGGATASPPQGGGFSSNGQAPGAHTPFDLADHPEVAAAIAHNSGDRSADTARIVAACVDARLTLAECRWAVQQHPGAAARLAARHDDDVLTLWIKTIDDRHQQVRIIGQPGGDPAPVPLSQRAVPPPFPVDALPKATAAMVWAVSRATETDPALGGSQALAALSACTTGWARFTIRDGWTEPLNLYLASVAAVGERKSAVHRQIFGPLHAYEWELIEAAMPQIARAAEQREIARRELDNARKAAVGDPAKQAAALDAAVKLASIVVPVRPQLFAGDITSEAAEIRLGEQGCRLSVVSDEGGVLDVIAGRYNNNDPNLEVWLQAHSGDRIDVDRVGRDAVHLPNAYMTLGLMMQPATLAKITANEQFQGRGLLARFLYAWPESRVGSRDVGSAVSTQVADAYQTEITALAKRIREGGKPVLITPTAAARERIIELHRAVEPTLAEDDGLDLIRTWGSKYVGAAARIAGILHLADHPNATVVGVAEVERAILLGEYFAASTLNVLGAMGADPVVPDAEYLLGYITRHGLTQMSERDLHQKCRSRFPTRAALSPVIDRLVDNGYLIPIDTAATVRRRGRPPSTQYRLANFQGKP